MDQDAAVSRKFEIINRRLKKVGAEAYNIHDVKRYAPKLLELSEEELEAKDGHDLEAIISHGMDKFYALR